jgi:GTP pyrophosphokinase
MVQVRKSSEFARDGKFDIQRWIDTLEVPIEDRGVIEQACQLAISAEQVSGAGLDSDRAIATDDDSRSAFHTGLEMASILAELRVDRAGLVAAILYRVVREGKLPLEQVGAAFGDETAGLIQGVLRMAAVSGSIKADDETVLGQSQSQADNVRRMLVGLIDDVRIALIKLAERSCAIRAVKNQPDKQARVAHEVFHIYAPLAQRLGIGHLKWELEDLAFRYLQSEDYQQVATLLDERRLDRQEYIQQVICQLQQSLQQEGLSAQVQGRAKHIYSIWRKMRRKGIGFSEVYDVRALRILVDRVQDCYAALGVVHSLWRNISSEFDDYIANPKSNGYQSLHTAVYGPGGKVLEVQIRTAGMHRAAEFGICAHWQYKTGDHADNADGYERKLAWLREVLEWHDEVGEQSGVSDDIADSLSHERIYVFTPEGHVVDLPEGATPIDFAYHIHTEVGHRCRGAKVNSRIVPLTYRLQTGEQVEILTSKNGSPSRDWLRSDLGYVRSARTRASIQQWFRAQARDENLALGRKLLEREFARLALTAIDYKALANHFKFISVEDMYVATGAGDLSPGQVISAAQFLAQGPATEQMGFDWTASVSGAPGNMDAGIEVRGVGKLLTTLAGCCKPVPGDPISGYITLGRGVTIHRSDCNKLLQTLRQEPQRLIEVEWGRDAKTTYPATIQIVAFDRSGLLRDISALLASQHINVIATSTNTNRQDNMATMVITMEVEGLDTLSRLLGRISQLPNIIDVTRLKEV